MSGTERHATTRRVDITVSDGARLACYLDGDAKSLVTVILVHGFTVTARLWRRHTQSLTAAGLRVVRFDLRAHGHSSRGSAPITIDRLGHDLAEVITTLTPEEDLVLAGHSMGGTALMAMAAGHPQLFARVLGVSLISTTADGVGAAPGTSARDRVLGICRGGFAFGCTHAPVLADRVRRSLPARHPWALAGRPAPADEERPSPCHRGVRHTASRDLAGFWKALTHHRQTDLDVLAGLGDRVQLLAGERDRHIPASATRRLAALLPGARLYTVPDADHALPVQHPDLVIQLLLELTPARPRRSGALP